ncbi:MAG TPA: ABC transporter permease [Gemmatimonadaceae bacterium]
MDALLQDLRFSLRSFRARPAVFTIAALSLALGISANTTIFAAIDAYLIRPLPFPDANRLAQIWETNPARGWQHASISVPDYLDWQAGAKSAELAAFTGQSYNLSSGDRPERVTGVRVSASFFRVLAVHPALGRWLVDDENVPGRNTAALLSDDFWRRRFAADRDIVGKTLSLDGTTFTVVGVMPPGFEFPYWDAVDLWTPLAISASDARANRNLSIIARARPGSSLGAVETELKSIAARLSTTYKEDEGVSVTLLRLDRATYEDDFRRGATISMVAVVFVLLIACANVANILLARASARGRELALRTALGANRARLMRQLLTESMLLAIIGGGLGAVLSVWGVKAFVSIIPPAFARTDTIALNGRALLFTLGTAVLAGLVFGTMPALHATRGSASGALREGGRAGTMSLRRNRLGAALVVSEIALALALLVSAGLLIKASVRLQLVDLGFDARHVMTMAVALPEKPYPDSTKFLAAETQLLERLRALPGVQSAGAVTGLPLASGYGTAYAIEGEARPKRGREPITQFRGATPGYLATMRIPLLRGRDFTDQDRAGAPSVMLVNESFVKRHWLTADPIGKRVIFNVGTPNELTREVIGVVRDTREFGPQDEPPATVFIPALQRGYRTLVFAVRSDVDPAALAASLRGAVRSVDPSLPAFAMRSMTEVITMRMAPRRIMPRLLTVFGAAALLLAIVGVYGVMSYSVSQRTREVGVRIALGAQRADILRLVVGQGALLAVIGLTIGLAAAAASTRGLGNFLEDVSAYDPVIFTGVTAVLGLSAVVASWIPARRALRVDPLTALKDE